MSNGIHFLPGDKLIYVHHLAPGASVHELGVGLYELGLRRSRNVITIVGGAAQTEDPEQLAPLFDATVETARATNSTLVYGGTDSGVLAEIGRAVRRAIDAGKIRESEVPLVAVAARGTLAEAFGREPRPDNPEAAPLQPDQDTLITVHGSTWGDESRTIAEVSALLSRAHKSVTVLLNGGGITKQDAVNALAVQAPEHHRLVVVKGTGRAADEIAAAKEHGTNDPLVGSVAANDRTFVVTAATLAGTLRGHLMANPRPPQRLTPIPAIEPRLPSIEQLPDVGGRKTFEAGRVHGSMLGESDGRTARSGRWHTPGDPVARAAWLATPKPDRVEALDRLIEEARRLAPAMARDQAYRLGVRVGYWRSHDYYFDHPSPSAAGHAHAHSHSRSTDARPGAGLGRDRSKSLGLG